MRHIDYRSQQQLDRSDEANKAHFEETEADKASLATFLEIVGEALGTKFDTNTLALEFGCIKYTHPSDGKPLILMNLTLMGIITSLE